MGNNLAGQNLELALRARGTYERLYCFVVYSFFVLQHDKETFSLKKDDFKTVFSDCVQRWVDIEINGANPLSLPTGMQFEMFCFFVVFCWFSTLKLY